MTAQILLSKVIVSVDEESVVFKEPTSTILEVAELKTKRYKR